MSVLWPWVLAGVGVGIVNGLSRWRTVSHISPTAVAGSLRLALGSMVLRLGLVAGVLIGSLRHGIISGLLAFAGLFITRWIMVLWFNAHGGWSEHRPMKVLKDGGRER